MILAQQTVDAIMAIASSGGTDEEKLRRARSCIEGCRNTVHALNQSRAGGYRRDPDAAMGDVSTALYLIAELNQQQRPAQADFYDPVPSYVPYASVLAPR